MLVLQFMDSLAHCKDNVYVKTILDNRVLFLLSRGGARNFPTGGLNLPTRGLKYGFQGILNAKSLRQVVFHLPTGATMFRQGDIEPSSPPLAPPVLLSALHTPNDRYLGPALSFLRPTGMRLLCFYNWHICMQQQKGKVRLC